MFSTDCVAIDQSFAMRNWVNKLSFTIKRERERREYDDGRDDDDGSGDAAHGSDGRGKGHQRRVQNLEKEFSISLRVRRSMIPIGVSSQHTNNSLVITHALDWPTLTVEWLPDIERCV